MKKTLTVLGWLVLLGLLVLNTLSNLNLQERLARVEAERAPIFRGGPMAGAGPAATASAGPRGATPSSASSSAAAAASSARAAAAAARAASASAGVTSTSVPLDIEDPQVRSALATYLEEYEQERKDFERARGVDQYLDHMEAKTRYFAGEFGVDEETASRIFDEIDERTQEWVLAQHAAEDGELVWEEAKAEQRAIEAQGRANLVELLGEDLYQDLERVLWGGGD